MEILLVAIFGICVYFALLYILPSRPKGENLVVPIEDLREYAALDDDWLYDIGFWRQSGNLHRVGSAAVGRDTAIKEVQTAFRRAKVDHIRIKKNTKDELKVWRVMHHGRGTQEGKRLGGASVKKILAGEIR